MPLHFVIIQIRKLYIIENTERVNEEIFSFKKKITFETSLIKNLFLFFSLRTRYHHRRHKEFQM